MGTRILHFADVHYNEKDHDEIKKCMEFMISHAEKSRPDAIICSGDTTNSQYLGADTKSVKTISEQFRRLSDIAPVAVIIGTPSHDGQTPELLRYVSGKNPIHVSTKPEQIYLRSRLVNKTVPAHNVYSWVTETDIAGTMIPINEIILIVTQIPAPTKEHWKNRQGAETDNQNIAQAMGSIFSGFGQAAKQFPQVPHILNGHFSMKGSKISETQTLPGTDISIDTETLSMAQADLCCLGHIHMAQGYGFPTINIFHSGSIYRKDFGEQGMDKGFYVHDICDDNEPNCHEFVKVPTREMVQLDYDLIKNDELLNDNFIWQVVQDIIASPGTGKPGFWVKIKITLWIDDIRRINQSALKQGIVESGADNVILEINRVRRENSREETILRAELLVDKVRALAEHRCQPAPDGVFEMLEKVETLSAEDLVKYAKTRLNQDKPAEIVKESDSVNENEREVA